MTHTSPAAPFTRYQKLVLAVLTLLQFTVILDFMIIAPIGDILIKSLDITTQQFGFVVSSSIFSAALAGFIAAGFVDKFDRKKVLLFFFSGFIIGTLLCALSNSYSMLLASRIIAGIFGGVMGSIILTIITDLFAPNQRGRAMSMVQIAIATSQIAGIPLGLFIANTFDWHYMFFFIVILSLLILLVVLFKVKPLAEHLNTAVAKNPFLHLWDTIKNKQHQVGFIAILFLAMGMMLQPFISIFLVNNIQITSAQLPIVFMVTGASAFIVMPLIGKLSDTYDRFKIFLVGSIITIVLVPVFTHLPVVPLWVVLVLNMFLYVAIISRMSPFQALNTMIPQPANRGAYMSVSAALQQMAGGLGVVIASSIVFQASPTSPLERFGLLGYVVSALALIACVLVYRVSVIAKQNMPKQAPPQGK